MSRDRSASGGTSAVPVRRRLQPVGHHDAAGDARLAPRARGAARGVLRRPGAAAAPAATSAATASTSTPLLADAAGQPVVPPELGALRRDARRAPRDADPHDRRRRRWPRCTPCYAQRARQGPLRRQDARSTCCTSSCSRARSRRRGSSTWCATAATSCPSLLENRHGPTRFPAAVEYWRERVLAGRRSRRAARARAATTRSATRSWSPTPSRALRSLCAFLDLAVRTRRCSSTTPGPARSSPARSTRRRTSASRSAPTSNLRDWRTTMPDHQVQLFEALAGDALDTFGYERSGDDAVGPGAARGRDAARGYGCGVDARRKLRRRASRPSPCLAIGVSGAARRVRRLLPVTHGWRLRTATICTESWNSPLDVGRGDDPLVRVLRVDEHGDARRRVGLQLDRAVLREVPAEQRAVRRGGSSATRTRRRPAAA